jgi:uncharacterized protein (DUF697 family)/energy-coupling factor transporter ATP-binding protein EcfA2
VGHMSETAPARSLKPSIVRIWGPDNAVIGAGFLVSANHVLTAAHVARRARQDSTDPLGHVTVDFPLISRPGPPMRARVVFVGTVEAPDVDVAGLVLEGDPPDGVKPVHLVTAESVWGHRFRAHGFPSGRDRGEWASGRLLDAVEGGWIMIAGDKSSGVRVRPGYSGAPVWDDVLNATTGMVVAADKEDKDRIAYVLPASILVDAWSEVLTARAIPPSPYRGLYSFDETSGGEFYGREACVADVAGQLERRPIVALVSPSGSGKSSLIGAGVVPLLKSRGRWLVVRARPSKDPFEHLTTAIANAMASVQHAPAWSLSPHELQRLLKARRLREVLQDLLDVSGCQHLLLVIDQMEELYTLCRDESVRENFVAALTDTAGAHRGPFGRVSVLLALRSDFEPDARATAHLGKLLAQAVVRLPFMTDEELRRVVEAPATALEVSFEAGLVERILTDFRHQPGALPLLQFLLMLLWEEQVNSTMTLAAYDQIGGVAGSLSKYADSVYADLGEDDQPAARRVLLQLVGLTEGDGDTRKPLSEREVRSGDWEMVRDLALQRLLVLDSTPEGEEIAELAHESLARGWAALRLWIEEAKLRLETSDAAADLIIRKYALRSGVLNLLPFPLDTIAVAAAFARMGQQMARAYDAKLSGDVLRTSGIAMAEGIAATAGGVYAGGRLLKMVPGMSVWVGLLVQPPLIAATAYAVGGTWKYFFHVVTAGGKGPDGAKLREVVSVNFRNQLRHAREQSGREGWRDTAARGSATVKMRARDAWDSDVGLRTRTWSTEGVRAVRARLRNSGRDEGDGS